MIAEQLAGKRIAITGSTGFVGTALVERLLRSAPGCELVLLIRPSKRHDATERARREIFKNNAFDRLKKELEAAGGETFDEMIARRVVAVGGDVSTDGLGLNDGRVRNAEQHQVEKILPLQGLARAIVGDQQNAVAAVVQLGPQRHSLEVVR